MDKNANEIKCIDDTNTEESPPVNDENDAATAPARTTIYDLPRQVWLDIYEHLDYSSYLNLRLTCHHFLHLIDNYIGLRADFSENRKLSEDGFNFFRTVVLNEVQFENCKDNSRYNFQSIFQSPNCLKEVSFTGETNLKLIQDIVLNCHYLHLVEMTMDCKIHKGNGNTILTENENDGDIEEEENPIIEVLPGINVSSHIPPHKFHLSTVECLKLVPGLQEDDNNLRTSVVLSLLRATRSERLQKVIFQCELTEKITLFDLLITTVELMEKHPKLEAFFMAILNEEFLMSDSEATEYPYLDLESVDQFDHFRRRIISTGKKLNIQKMGVAMINRKMQLMWTDFMRTQNHLVHLSLTVNIEPTTFSQEMFDSFSGTLEQLAIRGKFEEPFNFQFIQSCTFLKEICLHNLQEHGGGGITPKCINMDAIPEGLESLILFQVVARTEEIRLALRKLEKLSTLVVFKCGHAAGETGIGLDCLQDILFKRTLQSILMVQFICGSTSEAENLAGVLYNMARDSNMRRPSSQRLRNFDDPDFPNEGQNVLQLPQVDGVNEDEMIFHPRIIEDHLNIPQERPVSRGIHRIPTDELSEAHVLEEETENTQPELEVQPNASGELPNGLNGELMTEILGKTNEGSEHEEPPCLNSDELLTETRTSANTAAPISLPPLSDEMPLEPEDFPPLPNSLNEEHGDDPRNGEEVRRENDERVLNMLQDILEHAVVQDPDMLEQRNPHLQDNMVLNRVHEINDGVELILDVEDQDLGPVLDLFEAERLAREHNVQVGFILDGVIDIMNEDAIRSKWLCVEDEQGHLTYTLKISVEL